MSVEKLQNRALVLIKPLALTESSLWAVKGYFAAKSLQVVSEGSVSGEHIDQDGIVDKHYFSIYDKARGNVRELVVPEGGALIFHKKFDKTWAAAVENGECCNAFDACKLLNLSPAELSNEWDKSYKAGQVVRLGGGFYCGRVGKYYVVNGFYMGMRSALTAGSVHYFVVKWDSTKMTFETFRKECIGANDPTKAASTSLRGMVYRNWEELGLRRPPTLEDNSIHGSASPLEALVEQQIWLGIHVNECPFGSACLGDGIAEKTLEEWG